MSYLLTKSYLERKYQGRLTITQEEAENETLSRISAEHFDADGKIALASVARIVSAGIAKPRSKSEVLADYTKRLAVIWASC